MARILKPDPMMMGRRVAILEELRVRFNLGMLLDFGYNPELNSMVDYPQITAIEIDPDVVGDGIVTGSYLAELPNHLTDSTCYTCFVFLNPPGQAIVDEEKFKAEFVETKKLLMAAGLKNSFLVLWIRSQGFQDYRVYDLENQRDITDQFAGFA